MHGFKLLMRIGLRLNSSESKTLKDLEIQREVDSLCLGTKTCKLRQRRGMTIQDVSILSGLSKSLLSQKENTYYRHPGKEFLFELLYISGLIKDFNNNRVKKGEL